MSARSSADARSMSRMKKQRRRSSARVVRAELARALAIFEHAVGPTREAVPSVPDTRRRHRPCSGKQRQVTLRAEQLGGGSVWTRRHLCEEPLHSFPHRQVLQKLQSRTDVSAVRQTGVGRVRVCPSECLRSAPGGGAPIHEAGKGRGLTGGAAGNRGAARGTLPRHWNPPSLSAVPSGLCGSGCARLHSSRSDAGSLRTPPPRLGTRARGRLRSV